MIQVGDKIEVLKPTGIIPIGTIFEITSICNFSDTFCAEHGTIMFSFSRQSIINGNLRHIPQNLLTGTNFIPTNSTMMSSGYWYDSEYDWRPKEDESKKEEIKCECGAWITYGKDCPPEYHSPTYCPIYKKEEK